MFFASGIMVEMVVGPSFAAMVPARTAIGKAPASPALGEKTQQSPTKVPVQTLGVGAVAVG
jgi:hypothetical protein